MNKSNSLNNPQYIFHNKNCTIQCKKVDLACNLEDIVLYEHTGIISYNFDDIFELTLACKELH